MASKDNSFQGLKVKYPFMLGTTSYIIPDEILPNVRMLSLFVDDIELILFESPEITNIPSNKEIQELKAIADDTNIGYTIHLPTARKAGSPDKKERFKFLDDARKIIHSCSPLNPRAWIFHLEGIHKEAERRMVREWENRCSEIIEKLWCEIEDPPVFAIENLTNPPGSLGLLEELVLRYCLCWGTSVARFNKKTIHVFASDHGITAEGVSPYPKEVTAQMVQNMLSGGAAITVMCHHADVRYNVVDIGVDYKFMPDKLLIDRKIAAGTNTFINSDAMTSQQVRIAIQTGISLGRELRSDITAIGEMGIGNTSSASALFALLLDKDSGETVGSGTGVSGDLLDEKLRIIDKALAFHRKQWDKSPVDALKRVGGFEIAGMTGYILGCASKGIPVVIDGFIATASALCSIKMKPNIKDYLFFGHVSSEKFHKYVLKELGVSAILNLGMRLGEGTGAILAMQIIEQALNCYHNMATFSSAGVANRDF